ncbi:MAG: helix-turn-helix transcriptional regulator [Lamprobacter sp.]|uniref:helix-turn-helix transcriptional regulator n=1 Tax=Lamprobacter sp. TaxID=3100796 RepID=UPI002B259EEA|nr:helix-turn-helix transcriptional regulator [Lamprobacter sp.]MEA3641860.1 helix-turn-helix transcriptional regulator [Lamprobacter sp.]
MSTPNVPWYIKARRRATELDLSYQAMADRLGVKKPTVGHWMIGRHYPSLPMLEKIAAMLETSSAELISEDSHFIRNEIEMDAVKVLRETPAEYQAQAVAMLRAFKNSIPSATDD